MMHNRLKRYMHILPYIVCCLLHSHVSGQQQTGRITGHVINRTEVQNSKADVIQEERAVPNQAVTLYLLKGTVKSDTRIGSALTDSDGEFIFEGVDLSGDHDYFLTTTYQGVDYFERVLITGTSDMKGGVQLVVFDATSEIANPVVVQHHILIEPGQDSLFVQEFLRFLNVHQKTYVGLPPDSLGLRKTLRFSLPEDASTPNFQMGLSEEHVTFDQSGFSDSQPVPPGHREVLFTYAIPFTHRSLEFRRNLNYAHTKLDLFLASQSIHVSSPDLTKVGMVGAEEAKYIRYTGQNLNAGHELTITLKKTTAIGQSSLWLLAGAFLATLFIIARLVVSRRRRGKPVTSPGDRTDFTKHSEALIQAIADLDERYEGGKIDVDEYRRERERLKSDLSQIMRSTE